MGLARKGRVRMGPPPKAAGVLTSTSTLLGPAQKSPCSPGVAAEPGGNHLDRLWNH